MWLVLTLVLVAAVVIGLVAYLLSVIVVLTAARRDIAGIADALESVVAHTSPLERQLVTINGALSALADGLATADRHLGRAAGAFRL